MLKRQQRGVVEEDGLLCLRTSAGLAMAAAASATTAAGRVVALVRPEAVATGPEKFPLRSSASLESYRQLFFDPFYLRYFATTLGFGLLVTLLCVLAGALNHSAADLGIPKCRPISELV